MKMLCVASLLLAFYCPSFCQSDMVLRHNEKGNYLDHKVQPKENFYSIGRLYNISPKDIAAFNGVEMEKGLNREQILKIPLNSTNFTQGQNSGTPVYARVSEKDDLKKIASASKVSVDNIRRWNSMTSDKVNTGSKLVVGFLISKEMAGQLTSKPTIAATEKKPDAQQPAVAKKEEIKMVVKKDEPKTTVKDPVVETTNSNPKLEKSNADVSNAKTETSSPDGQGYFKSTFDQQVKANPASKQQTLTSGIFKTASGWQDSKYYLLMDGVQPGMVVKLMNPDNNKIVYAKVLGEMSTISQNEGLNIRISNSAASRLQVADQDKFTVRVSY